MSDDPEIIWSSSRKQLLLLGVACAVFLLGVGLLLWKWPGRGRFRGRDLKALLVGALAVLVGGATAVWAGLEMFRRSGLKIGADSLQLVTGSGWLRGNIPYSNIEKIELFAGDRVPFVCIWLRDPYQPGTHWPGGWLLRKINRLRPGCDISLSPEWKVAQQELLEKLQARHEALSEREPPPQRPDRIRPW